MLNELLLGTALLCGQTEGQRVEPPLPSRAAAADDFPMRRAPDDGLPARPSRVAPPAALTPQQIPVFTQSLGMQPGLYTTQMEPTPAAEEEPVLPPIEAVAGPRAAAPDRWLFMRSVQGTWPGWLLDGNRTSLYGWTEGSYTASSQGRINWPMLFQSPTNRFLLNQNWIVLERTVVTSGTTSPTVGFRFDGIVPGTDARFVQQRGLFNGQTTLDQFDLYQFFGEVYIPTIAQGLDIKLGRVAVPYMAEVTPNVFNPLFSHSYAYYYNPFTHTGVVTSLKLTNKWTVGGWYTLGNDVFFDPAASGMFVGVVQYTSEDQRDTALVCVGISSARFNQAEAFGNQSHIDVVATHKFNARLRYTSDSGVGYMTNVPGIGRTYWTWGVNYLSYDFTPRLTGNVRYESFYDADGIKTGTRGTFLAGTAGFTFKPFKSLLVRPEIRYDYNYNNPAFNGQRGLFTAATDMIVRW